MEEFFGELFGALIGNALAALVLFPLGFLYLHLRHWNRRKRQQVLVATYENSYVNAGKVLVESAIRSVLVLLLAAWLLLGLGVILGVIWNGLTS